MNSLYKYNVSAQWLHMSVVVRRVILAGININTCRVKKMMIDRLFIPWRSIFSGKAKRDFLQAVSVREYWRSVWKNRKRIDKKLDRNYTGMLLTLVNKSRKQHLRKQHLYSDIPLISQVILVRQTRHADDSRRSEVLLWIPTIDFFFIKGKHKPVTLWL